jgi:ribonuclease VapC
MIVIDTSAIIAILKNEPERRSFTEAIERAETCRMSAATYVETSMVLKARNGYEGLRDFDLFLLKAGIIIETVDAEQAGTARTAFSKFGKGRHKAGLNFGDCFSYALAKTLGVPLLFKGDDFNRTDIRSAVNR